MDTTDLSHHILSRFNADLEGVRSGVLQMGGLVERQLQNGVKALTLGDSRLGEQVASLDHAMWFHRPFRADEWLLYDQDTPAASGARGLARGLVYRADGTIVASVVQEGLIRRVGR